MGWLSIIACGFIMFAGQVFRTKGFLLASAVPASVLRHLDLVFVILWDLVLLQERLSLWSLCGATLVMFGALARGALL